jgi:hypothetical protein
VTFARCRVLSACRTSEVSNRFVVEVPHRVHRRLRPVHLKDPLMKVAKRLARYGAIALGHELAAAAARPMAVKHGPDPCSWGRGFEVDLDDLAGGVSAHHDMQEQSHADIAVVIVGIVIFLSVMGIVGALFG